MANTAPTLTGLDAPTFLENTVNGAPQLIDANVTFTDPDDNFDGGKLTVSGVGSDETVAIRNQGTAAGQIGFSAGTVTFGGTVIGTATGGNGTALTVTFNADATSVAIDALIQNLTYATASDTPAATRTLTIKVTDDEGASTTGPLGFVVPATDPVAAVPFEYNTAPTFGDLDNDGDLDLILGDVDGALHYYTNTGTRFVPVFAEQTGTNNPFDAFSTGGEAKPVLIDLDDDGDLDLVVGGINNVFYYLNTGTASAPVFVEQTGGANPFSVAGSSIRYAPAFADLDNDGDFDLLLATSLSGTRYFENTGSATAPAYTLRTGAADPFSGLIPGVYLAPTLGDVDGDGDADLIVGRTYDGLLYFENIGTVSAPTFVASAQSYGAFGFSWGSTLAVPTLADIDGDGDLDIAVGMNVLKRVRLNTWADGVPVVVNVTEQNDAPENTVPGAQSVLHNASTAITGLEVDDADAGTTNLTTTLTVQHGTLTATGTGVSGSGTATVTIVGTLTEINAALATVVYTGVQDYVGPDKLTMVTDDGGNTGGGALSDTDEVAIQVGTVITGTQGADSYIAPAGPAQIDALYGNDTIVFNFKLTEAVISYVDHKVIIDGPGSSYALLSGFEKFVFTDGTVNNADGNELVDDLFYFSRNHDVWNAGMDADTHYELYGWREVRDPNGYFSTAIYLSQNPELKGGNVSPVTHFHEIGWKSGIVPSLTFDPGAYLDANPDVKAAGLDPLAHYLYWGRQEGRQAIAPTEILAANGFDYVWYLEHYPGLIGARVDPLLHFQTWGWKEGRTPNEFFDAAGYLATYTDVAAAGMNPLDHYNLYGWKEGRDPSPGFDTTDYLAANPDVAAAKVNPMIHYLMFGQHEGRTVFSDGVWG